MNANGEARTENGERRRFRYSPERRTALVLCGTGAHGAYHAGVLRALQEAGVKIDVMAGQGAGAGAAALAAIDGGARLWEPDGIWRSPAARSMYRWKWPLRAASWVGALLVATLAIPFLFVLVGGPSYPIYFLSAALLEVAVILFLVAFGVVIDLQR